MSMYLDYNATAPCTRQHLEQIVEKVAGSGGNPSSIHYQGRAAKKLLEEARGSVAAALGATHSKVFFTSGATESNNLALLYASQSRAGQEVVLGAGDHPSVARMHSSLEEKGHTVRWIALNSAGQLDLESLEQCLSENTGIVSLLYVHNETGIVSDLEGAIRLIRDKSPKAHVHVDAVQALGKIDISWLGTGQVDSVSLSAHKAGGVKGVGALYWKPKPEVVSLFGGGNQEFGMRPGTQNLLGSVSFGLICNQLGPLLESFEECREVWLKLVGAMETEVKGFCLHGSKESNVGNTIYFSIDGMELDQLLLKFELNSIAVASGSACSSGIRKPSPALISMGVSEWEAQNSVRVSLGHQSDGQVVKTILDTLRV